MFPFLKIQYDLGRLDREGIFSHVPRWISQLQAEEICGPTPSSVDGEARG